jgi:hypothetical protein
MLANGPVSFGWQAHAKVQARSRRSAEGAKVGRARHFCGYRQYRPPR